MEHSGSGQTVKASCRERGLTTSTFYTWRKRMRGSAAERFLEVQAPAARVGDLLAGLPDEWKRRQAAPPTPA